MASKKGDAAQIPIRLSTEGIRDDLKNVKKTMESSMTELNSVLEVSKKVYDVAAKAAGAIADQLERGVKAAIKAEGPYSTFGRRLNDASKSVNAMYVALGKTVTQSREWNKLLAAGIDFTDTMTKFFKSPAGKEWADEIARTLRGAARGLIQALQGAYLLGRDLGLFDTKIGSLQSQITAAEAAEKALKAVPLSPDAAVRLGPTEFGDRSLGLSGLYSATGKQTFAGLDRAEARRLVALLPTLRRQLEAAKSADPFSDLLDALTASLADTAKQADPRSATSGEKVEPHQDQYAGAMNAWRRTKAKLDAITRFKEGNELDAKLYKDQRRDEEVQAKVDKYAVLAELDQAEVQRRADAHAQMLKQQEAFTDGMVASMNDMSLGFISGGIAAAAAAIGAGENVLASLKSFAGGMLQTVGQTLIQFGVAATLGGLLGDVVPFLKPFAGAGEAVGPLAIAGGAAIMAVGAALSGGGSGATTSYSTGFAGSVSSSPASYGISTVASSAPVSRVTNVYVQALAAGSPSEVGRVVKSYVKAAEARGY